MTSHANDNVVDVDLNFASAGWLHIYQLGVVRALATINMDNTAAKISYSGASSGAIASLTAFVAASGHGETSSSAVSVVDDIASFSMNCSEHYRQSIWNLFSIRDYLQAGVRKFGSHIDTNFEAKVPETKASYSQRLTTKVSVTAFPSFRQRLLTKFASVDDVEEALCATCSPLVLPTRLREHGIWVLDGSLTLSQLRPTEEDAKQQKLYRLRKRLTQLENQAARLGKIAFKGELINSKELMLSRQVLPLKDKIEKLENSTYYISVSPFYFTNATIRPSVVVSAWWALYPPSAARMRFVYSLGYLDTIRYLEARGMEGEIVKTSKFPFPFELEKTTEPKSTTNTNFILRVMCYLHVKLTSLFQLLIVRPIAISCVFLEVWVKLTYFVACTMASLAHFFFFQLPKNIATILFVRGRSVIDTIISGNSSFNRGKSKKDKPATTEKLWDKSSSMSLLVSTQDLFAEQQWSMIVILLQCLCSHSLFLRLLFNSQSVCDRETQLAKISIVYRFLQPLIFHGGRKGIVFIAEEHKENKFLFFRLTQKANRPSTIKCDGEVSDSLSLGRVASLTHSVASSRFSSSAPSMPEEEQPRARQHDEEEATERVGLHNDTNMSLHPSTIVKSTKPVHASPTDGHQLYAEQKRSSAGQKGYPSSDSVAFGLSDTALSISHSPISEVRDQQRTRSLSPKSNELSFGVDNITPAMLSAHIALLGRNTTDTASRDRWARSRSKLKMVALLALQLMLNNMNDLQALSSAASSATSNRSPSSLDSTVRSMASTRLSEIDSSLDDDEERAHQLILIGRKRAEVKRQAKLLMGIFKATSIALMMTYGRHPMSK